MLILRLVNQRYHITLLFLLGLRLELRLLRLCRLHSAVTSVVARSRRRTWRTLAITLSVLDHEEGLLWFGRGSGGVLLFARLFLRCLNILFLVCYSFLTGLLLRRFRCDVLARRFLLRTSRAPAC